MYLLEKCTVCGVVEVFSTDPDTDYCLTCYMTGAFFEKHLASEDRSFMLDRIRQLPHVLTARVYHHGGGDFQLVICLRDGRIVTPGAGASVNGQRVVMPFVPDASSGWGVLIRQPVEADNEWSGMAFPYPEKYDDDELVELVAGLDALP